MLQAYAITLTALAIAKAFDHDIFVLMIPATHEKHAFGYVYNLLVLVSAFNCCFYCPMVLVCDLLPMFCMIRVAASLKLLRREIRKSVESDAFKVMGKR